ncbi:MAG: ATP-binding protein [Candidatus Omnitrophota bacterium]|nr:ATP-binding protein [Candidatus Omnitrophota bacterium]
MFEFLRRKRKTEKLAETLNSMAVQLQAQIRDLEAQRSQLEGILEGMTEGVLVEGPDGAILAINPAARNILGLEGEVPPGTRSGDLIRHPVLQEMIEQVRAGGRPRSRDLTLYSPSERHLRVRGDICRSPAGPAVLLVFHDITDLKRLENLRRDFVANVSHELKTPLTAIQGAVETLLGGALKDADRGKPFVESIAEESGRLRRLVDDLLTLAQVESKQEEIRPETIALQAFLEKEVARHQPAARSRAVSLNLEPVPPGLALPADREHLAQAVGNLLDNAIQYNRPGGRVTLKAFSDSGVCRIEVEDTGIGIPPEDLARIFERFYRVDKGRSRETGGTGLGLSIIKHIAEAHGGSVEVESRLGLGSRFTLMFPLA